MDKTYEWEDILFWSILINQQGEVIKMMMMFATVMTTLIKVIGKNSCQDLTTMIFNKLVMIFTMFYTK